MTDTDASAAADDSSAVVTANAVAEAKGQGLNAAWAEDGPAGCKASK